MWSWFRFASMECVSFVWFAIECEMADTSSMRDSVVRVRKEVRREVEGVSADRPMGSQLEWSEWRDRERIVPCRKATFRMIMVVGA